MEATEQLSIVLPLVTDLVKGIDPSQLDNPTPCANFTVEGVLHHMIDGAEAFAPAFRGYLPYPDTPITDPFARFGAAMAELLDSSRSKEAMTRTVQAPFGEVPGEVFARFVAFDGLMHGWDLAISTGQAYDPPAGLVEEIAAFAHQALAPEMRDGDTFAAEVEVPSDADPLTRLVAFSGRTV